jgi:RHH-type transcriptional regulator, rel operon repressor / antitoxin RelB
MRYIQLEARSLPMVISVDLDRDTDQRLEELAARTGKSKAEHAAQIIQFGLEDVEDYYKAVEASERIRRGEETVYSSDELRRELGLDH